MDYNDFEQNDASGGTYYATPRWNDFTIDDERRAKRRFSRFFLATFIYMLLANVVAIAVELIITLVMGEGANAILGSVWYVWGLNVFVMYIVAFPTLFLIVKGMKNTVRTKKKLRASDFLVFFLIGEALMTVGSLIGNYLNMMIGVFVGHEITNTTSELIESSPVWLIILVAVIIGPIVEELIFRKLLMDKLGMYGDRIAILVSAVAFGIFHGNLYQLFYAFLLGLLLAYVYSKTSNILYPILLHMLMNFFGSVLPLPLLDYMDRYTEIMEIMAAGGEYDMAEYTRLTMILGSYSLVQWGLVIAGFIFLYKLRKKFFVSDRCEVLIPKERRAAVILGNAGVILYISLMLVSMALGIIFP
ncbi:MAG: CPBP family intramembrane metalloprotease [Clostridia bacterium]|nr:CPBP family intramembrane metalloprotease [Clostridia bacterium]